MVRLNVHDNSVRDVYTRDAAYHPGAERYRRVTPHRIRDALLNAVSSGKTLALGEIWTGIERARDLLVEVAGKLDTPITPPNILTAEPGPDDLDLGYVRDGIAAVDAFETQVRRQAEAEGRAALLDEVEQFHASVGTSPAVERHPMTDGLTDSEIARRRQYMAPKHRMLGSGSKPIAPSTVNDQNKAWWDNRNSAAFNERDDGVSRNTAKQQEQTARQARCFRS